MSDIKLFRVGAGTAEELTGTTDTVEKSVQTLFEKNLDQLLGVRFLATEFVTTHGGRLDTLGVDENGCPVIIEYKRASNENVINQGLFYLDWLMDHRKDFEWLVMERLGKDEAAKVDWSAPRLICIAGDFTGTGPFGPDLVAGEDLRMRIPEDVMGKVGRPSPARFAAALRKAGGRLVGRLALGQGSNGVSQPWCDTSQARVYSLRRHSMYAEADPSENRLTFWEQRTVAEGAQGPSKPRLTIVR